MDRYSSMDMLALVADVNLRRSPKIIGAEVKREGERTVTGMFSAKVILDKLSPDDRRSYQCSRDLHWRFEQGQYQHTEVELSLLGAWCRWLILKHTEQTGGSPQEFQIDPGTMQQTTALPPGSYEQVIDAMHEGAF